MLSCISKHAPERQDLSALIDRLASSILAQKSGRWSWNYHMRDRSDLPCYPDDLDDTACALAALFASDKISDKAEALAAFTKNLISAETKPGEPYRTWLAPQDAEGWNDVDTAVNANIAYALALQGVLLDGLTSHIDSAVESGSFDSLYYKSRQPIIYFISRFYSLREDKASPRSISNSQKLAKECLSTVKAANDPLAIALAIASLANLGAASEIPRDLTEKAMLSLIDAQRADGLWNGAPLYVERVIDGEERYFASDELASAFCIEALIALGAASARKQARDPVNRPIAGALLDSIKARLRNTFKSRYPDFFGSFDRMLGDFEKKGLDKAILLLPREFDRALFTTACCDATLDDLGMANMLGWIGYTIQDDIMDDREQIHLLPLANICLRDSFSIFEAEAPTARAKAYVKSTFAAMDRANLIEIAAQRDKASRAPVSCAEKSLGHTLGPLIALARNGYDPGDRTFRSTENFFRFYIEARQMTDDAHDWKEDLFKRCRNTAHDELLSCVEEDEMSLDDLERLFWTKAIDKVARKIRYRLSKARLEAQKCRTLIDPAFLESLLSPIERSVQRALDERDRALSFIDFVGSIDAVLEREWPRSLHREKHEHEADDG